MGNHKKGKTVDLQDGDGKCPLYIATEHHQLRAVECLLKNGCQLDVQCSGQGIISGETALHAAIRLGFIDIGRLLISFGASLDVQTACGETPLHLAVRRGCYDLVSVMLQHGANPSIQDVRGRLPLHIALDPAEPAIDLRTRKSMTRMLLNSTEVNHCDTDTGSCPLHLAAHWGLCEIVMDMLKRGGKVNIRDNNGRTPLHYSLSNDKHLSQTMVRTLLMHGADIEVLDHHGKSSLETMLNNDEERIPLVEGLTKTILENKNDREFRKSLLGLSIISGNARASQRILESCVDLDTPDQYGYTLLHLATLCGEEDATKLLIQRGANINAVDPYTQSPLHLAAGMAKLSIAKCLVNAGSDVNLKDETGMGPLHRAAGWGTPDMVQFLIDHGADVYSLDKKQRTPLHIANSTHNTDTISLLTNYISHLSPQSPQPNQTFNESAFKHLEDSIADALDILSQICGDSSIPQITPGTDSGCDLKEVKLHIQSNEPTEIILRPCEQMEDNCLNRDSVLSNTSASSIDLISFTLTSPDIDNSQTTYVMLPIDFQENCKANNISQGNSTLQNSPDNPNSSTDQSAHEKLTSSVEIFTQSEHSQTDAFPLITPLCNMSSLVEARTSTETLTVDHEAQTSPLHKLVDSNMQTTLTFDFDADRISEIDSYGSITPTRKLSVSVDRGTQVRLSKHYNKRPQRRRGWRSRLLCCTSATD